MIRKLMVILLISGLTCLLGVTSALAVKYNEAPMLKVKVAAGVLPPVEERLPDEPQIVEPIEKIGQYGGTAHVYRLQADWPEDSACIAGAEPLFRIARDCKTIVPNIVKKWNFSKDGKTLTLYLRKGIKWSDGVPFTADDIMFWYEDILLNDELSPSRIRAWFPGGEPMRVEKVDDYAVRFCFAVPYPVIKLYLSHYEGTTVARPAHYLKQFHIKYNPKANELAKENGYNAWYEYFNAQEAIWLGVPFRSPDLPTLCAYKLIRKEGDYLVYERNPYYWKVDTEGNQLPYIDRILSMKLGNVEIYNGKIVSGEADFAAGHTSFDNYPLYKDSAREGNYRVNLWESTSQNNFVYQPNQTVKDPILRKIFGDVRFRQALSLAINREEINEDLYFGKAAPCQTTILPVSKYYKPEFEKAYAEYDPEEANRLLDEMGLNWDKNHEYRLRPDGKRLSWVLEYGNEISTPVNELVKEYWKEIGCEVVLKLISGELLWSHAWTNDLDMSVGGGGSSDSMFTLWPLIFIPFDLGQTYWGIAWAQWYASKGEEGEEPPEKIKNLYEWWEGLKSTMDEEENIRLGRNILASQAENLWAIGTVGRFPQPVITKSNLRNVPEKLLWGWDFLYTMPCPPEQFFFEHPLFPSQE